MNALRMEEAKSLPKKAEFPRSGKYYEDWVLDNQIGPNGLRQGHQQHLPRLGRIGGSAGGASAFLIGRVAGNGRTSAITAGTTFNQLHLPN
jgi:hypothetical protein